MLTRDSVTVRSILAAAGFALVVAIPTAAARSGGVGAADEATIQGVSTTDALNVASELIIQGQVVKARAMLLDLSANRASSLSDRERGRLNMMLSSASEKIKRLGPVETSLQTADEAIARGDYAVATRHASAVIVHPKATNEQVSKAKELDTLAQTRKGEFAVKVPALLASAGEAADAGQIADARSGIEQIVRSGVVLSGEQQAQVEALQRRVMSARDANAGMMQPGVIKRREVERPAEQPAPQPPVTPAPAPAAQPEPAAAQPAVQPVTPPAPSDDILTQARRFEAKSILAEAENDFNQARYPDAASKFSRLKGSFNDVLEDADRTLVDQRLAEINARLNINPGQGGNLLGEVIRNNQLAHDQAVAEFRNDVDQARRALEQGDPSRARSMAASANLRLNTARQYFSAGEFEEMAKEVAALRTEIDVRDEALRARTAQERETKLAQEAADAKLRADQTKDETIRQSLLRVRALQREQKYAEALQVVDDVLFLDPINETALVLRDVLQDVMIAQEYYRIHDKKHLRAAQLSLDNSEATIPTVGVMEYPPDWPAISDRRGEPLYFADTEDNRRALAILDTKRVPVDFVDTPLSSVLNFIQAVTQLNIDPDYASLESAGIDKDALVSLKLSNASIRTILDRVLEKVSVDSTDGAAWSVNEGIVIVASKTVINRNKVLVIYDIKDLLLEIPDYIEAPQFDLQSILQSTQGGGGGQSPFQDTENEPPPRRTLEDRTTDLINIITTNVDAPGWQENGGETGFIQQLQGNLIVTQTPANHREIQGLLRKLREARALQINVETRFLLVAQDFFEQIGVDLDVYFNANNNQARAARAQAPQATARDFFDFERGGYQGNTFVPRAADINRSGTTGDAFNEGSATLFGALPSPLSPVSTEQNSLGLAESLLSGEFVNGILSAGPALGIAGQFLDDIQVDFLVKATQADRRTVTLTAPRLTFTNGQTANISVATQIAFVSDLQPVVSDSAVGFDPTLATVNAGMTLLVDGVVSADRRYVTLNVQASIGNVDGFVNTPVSAIAGGQLVNSAATQSFIQLPTVTVTQVNTTVTVPDQGTILLGGQRLVTEQEAESGVPVLSKIPVINRLFSNRIMSKEEQTLMILMKPTVLIQTEQEEQNFPGLDDTLRMPFGG